MAFRPLHDRVVVKRLEGEEKTKGGIIIPDTAKEKPQEGKVIAVGPGGRDDNGKLTPPDVKAGDRILFGKWSGTEVKIDGEDSAHHEGKRHHGRRRLSRAPCTWFFSWGDEENGCQRRPLLDGCARSHPERHRNPQ